MTKLERYAQAMSKLADESGVGWYGVYDGLVWTLVTSNAQDLELFCDRYCGIGQSATPIPLKVLAYKLLGVANRNDPEKQEWCRNGIALYCDPIEEKNAVVGLE